MNDNFVPLRVFEEVCRERDMLRRELSTLKRGYSLQNCKDVTETHENSPTSSISWEDELRHGV